MTEYFTLPELPDRLMFHCEPRQASLAVNACQDNWRAAQGKAAPERLWKCRNCPIGAMHAGEGDVSRSPIRGASICGRCERPTNRLIKGHLCVSCYNREREAVNGRNARGSRPINHPPLHHLAIRVCAGGEVRDVELERAVSSRELVVKALRDTPKRVTFGYRVPRGASGALRQGDLFA